MSALTLRQRVCAAKLEGTPGTAVALAAADGAENFFDPTVELDVPAHERQGQSSYSQLASVPGAQSGKWTAKTELYNAAAAPFWSTVLMNACGATNTAGTIVPTTNAQATNTLGYYVSGNLYEICGAQGNFKISADKVGEPVMIDWEFTGVYVAPTAVALIAPTYPTPIIPRFAGATFAIGGVTPIVKKMSFDAGCKPVLRQSAATSTGYLSALITERVPKLNITVEVPAIGTHDYFVDLLTSVQASFSMAVGSGANGTVTLAVPKLQLRSAPKLTDQDGILTYDLEFGCNRNSSAGDDEWSLALS